MKHLKFFFLLLVLSTFVEAQNFESPTEPWGADAKISFQQEKNTRKKLTITQKIGHHAICFFQNKISDIDGPRSTFYPTSSEYTRQMICEKGFFIGIALGCDRLMRENNDPWVYRTVEKYGILRKIDN